MNKQVWLVDDDNNVRSAVRKMLGLLGEYEILEFPEARTPARTLLAGNKPDLLFLDINMPGVTGFELLKFIRQRDEWKNLVVLMVSSESDETLVEEAVRLGADGYVFKPVNIEELQMAITSATRRRQTLLEE